MQRHINCIKRTFMRYSAFLCRLFRRILSILREFFRIVYYLMNLFSKNKCLVCRVNFYGKKFLQRYRHKLVVNYRHL